VVDGSDGADRAQREVHESGDLEVTMTKGCLRMAAIGVAICWPALAAAEPPVVEHQPSPCTVAGKAIALCASITDDGQVQKSRIYFRAAGEKYWTYTDMGFQGLNFCGTVPAPRAGRVKMIEYYVQGIDDEYDSQRTSTFQMNIQDEGVCEFPPIEKDPARAGAIVVYATNAKQGKKLGDEFEPTGVTFVPSAAR
jgi:hypothetical protein